MQQKNKLYVKLCDKPIVEESRQKQQAMEQSDGKLIPWNFALYSSCNILMQHSTQVVAHPSFGPNSSFQKNSEESATTTNTSATKHDAGGHPSFMNMEAAGHMDGKC